MRKLTLHRPDYGPSQRLSYQENELANAAIVPNPVEYEDIDNAFCDFFRDNINMVDDEGKKFETYTFFSNQRFSEFSQTWAHDDKDGNLLMNFFSINRDNNPNWGKLHGGNYSIPGNNRFTVCMREILDDTGVECYEITSMSQPIQVDIKYRLNLVTAKYKYLNEFNIKANKLFESKQCYLCVNGHYMPMTLDTIGDSSDYAIDNRKFYIQSMDITVMGYIIPRDDLKVEIIPKRRKISTNLNDIDRKTRVEMEFMDDDDDKKFMLFVKFNPGVAKVHFSLDDDVYLEFNDKINANKPVIIINGEEYGFKERFKVHAGDDVDIKIIQPNTQKSSEISFNGVII